MPRKPSQNATRQAVQARLDDVDFAIVESARAARGIPMSEFVRLAVMQYAITQPGQPPRQTPAPTPSVARPARSQDISGVEFQLKAQAQSMNSMRTTLEQLSAKVDLQSARVEQSQKITERWFRYLVKALGITLTK